MLLALMRRSPRRIKTSQGKLPASLVSLADARACRPSLLLMVVRVLIMSVTAGLVLRGADGHPPGPLRATHDSGGDHRIERLAAVAHGAQQHRQVDPGHQARAQAVDQALRDVAGRV